MKRIVLLVVAVLAMAGCKEKDKGPRMANAMLYGHYYNDTALDNLRLFAMRLHADGTFTWYDAYNSLTGKWSQVENKVEFNFTTGSFNRWAGTITGNEIKDIIGPTPSNFHFSFVSIAKSGIPANLKNTEWREINRSRVLFIGPGQAEGKYQIAHGHFQDVGSEGLIYDLVDKQVLISSKTLNYKNFITMILLNGDNLVVYRYEANPFPGEKKNDTYTYAIK